MNTFASIFLVVSGACAAATIILETLAARKAKKAEERAQRLYGTLTEPDRTEYVSIEFPAGVGVVRRHVKEFSGIVHVADVEVKAFPFEEDADEEGKALARLEADELLELLKSK